MSDTMCMVGICGKLCNANLKSEFCGCVRKALQLLSSDTHRINTGTVIAGML